MKISLSDLDLSQSLLSFAQQYTATGKISLSLYGDKCDNYINGYEKLPYVKLDGMMQWGISMRSVTLYDLGQTFSMNVGNNLDIEFEEVQNWGTFEIDVQKMNMFFRKHLRHVVKAWRPLKHSIAITELIRLIRWTNMNPEYVLDAIWLKDFYSAEEFATLFSLKNKVASKVLEAAGYMKKDTDHSYYLVPQRVESIRTCLEKSKIAYDKEQSDLTFITKWKKHHYDRVTKLGESISEYGKRKTFFSSVLSSWEEPAYTKRTEWPEKLLSIGLTAGMVLFIVIVIFAFCYQMIHYSGGQSDSLYSFWGAIAGAMVAGLVTIFTTYFIIRRSYKLDYHQERMAVIPFFEIEIKTDHFSTEEQMPDNVKKILENHSYYDSYLKQDARLLEIKNVGNGPAFDVELEGVSDSYDEPYFQSIVVSSSRYAMIDSGIHMKCRLRYYDIYGNYYYQNYEMETSVCGDSTCDLCTKPPELVLRTSRIRYVQ